MQHSTSTRRSVGVTVAFVMIMALAGMPAASAGTATLTEGVAVFAALDGEVNQVTVEGDPLGVIIHDSGAVIAPGDGCVALTDNSVRCAVATDGQVSITLGDVDDTLQACIACPVPSNSFHVDAGPGSDTVDLGRIARPGTIGGGDGHDALTGGEGAETISGGEGDDILDTGGGRPV